MTLDEALAHRARHGGWRAENFAMGLRLLPSDRRRDVRAVLDFVGATRDLADESVTALDPSQRLELLDLWEKRLDRCAKGEPAEPVFPALGVAIGGRRLPAGPFHDLIAAARQDVTKGRYGSYAEVKDYCGRVANPIGRLVLHVCGHRDEEQMRLSDRLCTGLQLASFWQDMSADLERDRIYLPGDEMESFGVTEEALKARRFDEGFLRLMQFQVRRAREVFDSARRLPNVLEGGLKMATRMTWLGGVEILGKIEALGFDTLNRRPRLSRLDPVWFWARAALRKW